MATNIFQVDKVFHCLFQIKERFFVLVFEIIFICLTSPVNEAVVFFRQIGYKYYFFNWNCISLI